MPHSFRNIIRQTDCTFLDEHFFAFAAVPKIALKSPAWTKLEHQNQRTCKLQHILKPIDSSTYRPRQVSKFVFQTSFFSINGNLV
jgi:hypothetical protein